jgi:hypothetical protein
MATPQEYDRRIAGALEGNTEFKVSTAAEGKLLLKQIVQVQKELRQIKKEIGLTVKDLRGQYADQKAKVGKGGFGTGVMQGLFGKKAVGGMNAAQKNKIRQNQDKQLDPYEDLQRKVDRLVLEYDSHKLKIEGWIAQQKD